MKERMKPKIKSALESNKEYSEEYVQKIAKTNLPKVIIPILQKCKNFADLGCGDGGLIIAIKKRFPKMGVIGADISPRRIKGLKEKFKGSKDKFLVEDVCNTSIKKSSLDFVSCEQVIEHVENDKALAKEISRILKPKSYLYISSVIKKPWAWYKYKNRFGKRVLDPTHEREYSSKEKFLDVFKEDFRLVKLKTCPVERKMLIHVRIPGYYIVEGIFQKRK